MPQRKFIEVDNNIFTTNVPIMTPFVPSAIAYFAFKSLAF